MQMSRTAANIKRSAHLVLLTLLLLAVAPMRQPTLQAAHQVPVAAAAQPQSDLCDQSVAVTASECGALIELYNSTGGANWLNRTGWLTFGGTVSPCDWFGVVCADGHVVELNLSRNGLKGDFPKSIGNLTALRGLALAGNQLQGAVPHGICTLVGRLTTADLSYNALFTRRPETQTCLGRLDSDWAETQTTPPLAFSATRIESNAVQMAWTPSAYTIDGGFYEVSYATAREGPFITHTIDLQDGIYELTGLASGVTYFLRIQTVTPAHAGNPTEVHSDYARTIAVTRTSESILMIVYFPADNDLSPQVPAVVERLRRGTQFNPNVRVVLLSDRNGDTPDTQVVTIAEGVVRSTTAVTETWPTSELDTADSEVLGWFLKYARDTFPASHEIVALMGHGLALAPEIEWPDTGQHPQTAAKPQNGIPALPKGMEATPGDITSSSYMSTVDLGRALAAATDNGARPFDLLFLDQCFQGNLDTLYEIRTAADIFIASPNYAWLVAPYDEYLALLAPGSTTEPASITEQFADAIITRYQLGLNDRHPNVIFWVRRADIEAVAAAVSTLGEALIRAMHNDPLEKGAIKGAISAAASDSQHIDTTQCDDQEKVVLRSPDELIGADSFANKLHIAFADNRYGVKTAAVAVHTALDPIHKSTRVGHSYLAPGELWDYTNTITILAPLPPDTPAAVAWRSSVYTETMPLTATWTPVPTRTVQVTASYAYVRDGSWDEFLAGWYDAPLAPTVGEWCHYIPPAIVGGDDLEPLTLEAAAAGEGTVQLTWSQPENDDAVGYWLYEWDLDKVSWVARQWLAFGQTSSVIPNILTNGRYRFLVVAQNESGAVVAQSNEVEWPAAQSVYLPLVTQD